MIKDVRAALIAAGWNGNEFGVYPRGATVTVALGLDLARTSASRGGNAAGALVGALRAAGFELNPTDWQHLLSGKESVVSRVGYPIRWIARELYGERPSTGQLRAAAQWAWRRMEPLNQGQAPLLWPAGAVEAALEDRAALHASGRRHPGNRTRGLERRGGRSRKNSSG
jgi:hypothetical protein